MTLMNVEALINNGIPEELARSNYDFFKELHGLIIKEQYADAQAMLNNCKAIEKDKVILVRKAFSALFLINRSREWTSHGVWRTFRFWTQEEKVSYLKRANILVESLKQVTPLVTYGFGSVLGFVRDKDFIPHDDDMDLLVAIPTEMVRSYNQAKNLLIAHLSDNGINCYNENRTHFTANGVDVFIGFIEQDKSISWFPSRRRPGMTLSDIFPSKQIEILGVKVDIPNNAEYYLELTYGANWSMPDSAWLHPWAISEFAEYLE